MLKWPAIDLGEKSTSHHWLLLNDDRGHWWLVEFYFVLFFTVCFVWLSIPACPGNVEWISLPYKMKKHTFIYCDCVHSLSFCRFCLTGPSLRRQRACYIVGEHEWGLAGSVRARLKPLVRSCSLKFRGFKKMTLNLLSVRTVLFSGCDSGVKGLLSCVSFSVTHAAGA